MFVVQKWLEIAKMNRAPKIKVPKHELKDFLLESLQIDPFWSDLIANGDRKKKKHRQ